MISYFSSSFTSSTNENVLDELIGSISVKFNLGQKIIVKNFRREEIVRMGKSKNLPNLRFLNIDEMALTATQHLVQFVKNPTQAFCS